MRMQVPTSRLSKQEFLKWIESTLSDDETILVDELSRWIDPTGATMASVMFKLSPDPYVGLAASLGFNVLPSMTPTSEKLPHSLGAHQHSWKPYNGFNESYMYCDGCPERKPFED